MIPFSAIGKTQVNYHRKYVKEITANKEKITLKHD